MNKLCLALLGGSLVFVSRGALAQEPGNLGNQGQIVVGVDRVMGLSFETWSVTQVEALTAGESVETTDTNSRTIVSFLGTGHNVFDVPTFGMTPRLAFDFFPTQGLSVGGSFVFVSRSGEDENETVIDPATGTTETTTSDADTQQTLIIHPRLGYAIQIDRMLALWPRLGITWASLSRETETGSTYTVSALDLTLEALLGISPFEHFAILVGPYGDIGLSGTSESETDTTSTEDDITVSSFGLTTSIVGYFP
jgi:hypothetical protein